MDLKALVKLANTGCQTLLSVSISLIKDNNIMADLELKQLCLASNVGQSRQSLKGFLVLKDVTFYFVSLASLSVKPDTKEYHVCTEYARELFNASHECLMYV